MKAPIDFLKENPERYRKLARGEQVDYAPFRLWLDQTFVWDFTGVNPRKYATDLEVQYQAQKKVDDRFYGLRDYEVGVDLGDLYFDFRRFHADTGKNNALILEESLDNFDKYASHTKIEDLKGVQNLKKAVDFYNKRLPKEKAASFYHGCTGTMDLFSLFRGTEKFFIDLYDKPDKVNQIFEFLTQRNLEWLEYQEKTWGHYNRENNLFDKIDIGEDYCAYLQPDLFDEFVIPYTGKLVEAWKGRSVCGLHTDGDMPADGIEKLNRLGIDELMGFSPNIDIKEFRRALPDVILGGNPHPIYDFIEGTPESLKKKIKYCFEAANQNQKFILCSGGAITAGAKPEIVDAFLEAAYEIVKY